MPGCRAPSGGKQLLCDNLADYRNDLANACRLAAEQAGAGQVPASTTGRTYFAVPGAEPAHPWPDNSDSAAAPLTSKPAATRTHEDAFAKEVSVGYSRVSSKLPADAGQRRLECRPGGLDD